MLLEHKRGINLQPTFVWTVASLWCAPRSESTDEVGRQHKLWQKYWDCYFCGLDHRSVTLTKVLYFCWSNGKLLSWNGGWLRIQHQMMMIVLFNTGGVWLERMQQPVWQVVMTMSMLGVRVHSDQSNDNSNVQLRRMQNKFYGTESRWYFGRFVDATCRRSSVSKAFDVCTVKWTQCGVSVCCTRVVRRHFVSLTVKSKAILVLCRVRLSLSAKQDLCARMRTCNSYISWD